MRRFLALAALWVLLAACTDGGATEPGSTSTPSATASASGSPSASASAVAPPVMPEVAKEHTEAGAVAFVQHFWDVVNYAQATLDVRPLERLITEGCDGCRGGIEALREVKERGGVVVGGTNRTGDFGVKQLAADSTLVFEVTFTVTNDPETIDYPPPAQDVTRGGASVRDRFILFQRNDGWRVGTFEVLG